ncbi:hypothetical protein ACO2Q3_11625 [Caulobacter sp. KR2-114]|uniref:hypothetical protein n=1 Tax=Caulobacter sp. KR2-114 TaxID=3400912 RepID=UPI003C01B45E
MKVGQTAAGYQADLDACLQRAKAWPGDGNTGLPPPIGAAPITDAYKLGYNTVGVLKPGQAVAASLLAIPLEAALEKQNVGLNQIRCMRTRGYALIALNQAENYGFRHAAGGQGAWLEAFARKAAPARLQATVAPLPEVPHGPFYVGAVRLEPDGLALAQGAVRGGDAIVTGQAHYRRTARLKTPFKILNRRLAEGTEFFAFAAPMSWDPDLGPATAAWCLPAPKSTTTGLLAVVQWAWCVRAGSDGYDGFLAVRESNGWLVNAIQELPRPVLRTPIVLAPDDQDALGPLALELKVERVDDDGVVLAAWVSQPDKLPVLIWRGRQSFGTDGRAILPFWTQALVLSRDGRAVTGAWATGDGRGWMDQIAGKPDEGAAWRAIHGAPDGVAR